MHRSILVVTLTIVLSTVLGNAFAADSSFHDLVVESPSKRYKVEAKSPDNTSEKGHQAFDYKCWDTSTKTLLWTRKQAMGEPAALAPKEGSPVELFVSDSGWTAIRTGWDELIAVDVKGHDHCHIKLLSEAITQEECEKYVVHTSVGLMWSGYSLWYFLEADGQQLFVIRPWWGRRVIVDIEVGKLVDETDGIAKGSLTYERNYVVNELSKAVETRQKWEQQELYDLVPPIRTAAYLAGRIHAEDAIPYLEKLQDSPYFGGSINLLSSMKQFEGKVCPHSYRPLPLRQVIHQSLRRLGRIPKPLPGTQFDVQHDDFKKNYRYVPKTNEVPRHTNVDKITIGMTAEQVLDLLGEPDFVGDATWEYDMDASPPFSLVVVWDMRSVIGVEKKTPALWKDGFARDKGFTN